MCPKSDAKSMLRRVFQKNINCIAALYKLITEINEMEIVCPATKAFGSTGIISWFISCIFTTRYIWLTYRFQIWNWRSKAHLFHKSNPVNSFKMIPLLQLMIHSHHSISIGSVCAFPHATTPCMAPFIPRISRCIFRFQINYNFNFTNYAFLSELLFNVLTSGKKAFSREKAINICYGHIFFWSSALLFTPTSFTFCCTEAWHLFIVKSSIFKTHVDGYFLTIKSRSNTLSGF